MSLDKYERRAFEVIVIAELLRCGIEVFEDIGVYIGDPVRDVSLSGKFCSKSILVPGGHLLPFDPHLRNVAILLNTLPCRVEAVFSFGPLFTEGTTLPAKLELTAAREDGSDLSSDEEQRFRTLITQICTWVCDFSDARYGQGPFNISQYRERYRDYEISHEGVVHIR